MRLPRYTLRNLLWLTAVVAVGCAFIACAKQIGGQSYIKEAAMVAILFWPIAAGTAAWTCPDVTRAGSIRVFGCVGAGIVLLSSGGLYLVVGPSSIIDIVCIAPCAGVVFWLPQAIIVLASLERPEERNDKREKKSSSG